MAAKESYKIPASIDESYMDMEITLKNKDGIGLRPLPIRVVLLWVASILILLFIVTNEHSPVQHMGLGIKILFSALWVAFTYLMTRTDDTRQMRIELVPPLMSYLSKSDRNVYTRRSNSPGPFYGIVGIEDIDETTGVVKYMDGTYGYWYSVVGSASVLLFPEDRAMILSKVDDFYKKLQPDCEIIFVTTKEPQKVVRQQAHLKAQYDNLDPKYHDPDIDKLYKEQYNVLTNFVGKEFKSLHQYMILKGDTREALSVINSIVKSECSNSKLVFKECMPLYQSDIEAVLRTIYADGGED